MKIVKENREEETMKSWSFKTIIEEAIVSFRDAIDEEKSLGKLTNFDPVDLIHDIADEKVPVMTWDILQYALHNITLATIAPEIKAFNGDSTGVNCIAGRMYETISEKLWEVWNEIEEGDKICG